VRSLNKFRRLRSVLVRAKYLYYTRWWGMDIHPTVQLSLRAELDRTYPAGVHIGAKTYVTFGAVILTHDRSRGLYLHTRIGRDCFIGAHSIIMPGVVVGDGSVVGAGAVVVKDVPPRSVVGGNPARILRSDIDVGPYGRFLSADTPEARAAAARAWSESDHH
jgi:acetyltransferase-like isoleucine patch superfamily enzyme